MASRRKLPSPQPSPRRGEGANLLNSLRARRASQALQRSFAAREGANCGGYGAPSPRRGKGGVATPSPASVRQRATPSPRRGEGWGEGFAFTLICGDDLVPSIADHDVVIRAERIVIFCREGLRIGLDQPFIRRFQVFKRLAHLIGIGRSGLLNRPRNEVQSVIGIRDADGREMSSGPFTPYLAFRAASTRSPVGLSLPKKLNVCTKCASPAVGPTSSGKRPPEIPQCEMTGAFQLMRSRDFMTCAPGAGIADEDEAVRAFILQARQLRRQINVCCLEFFHARNLDRLVVFVRRDQALSRSTRPMDC